LNAKHNTLGVNAMPQVPLPESASADRPTDDRRRDDSTRQIADNIAYRKSVLVNVVFVGLPQAGDGKWVLIDWCPEMHGPPMYFTPDWESARSSVRKLASLKPELVVTGHGQAMQGAGMQNALDELASRFDEVAVSHARG
jgi:hypothetical protein